MVSAIIPLLKYARRARLSMRGWRATSHYALPLQMDGTVSTPAAGRLVLWQASLDLQTPFWTCSTARHLSQVPCCSQCLRGTFSLLLWFPGFLSFSLTMKAFTQEHTSHLLGAGDSDMATFQGWCLTRLTASPRNTENVTNPTLTFQNAIVTSIGGCVLQRSVCAVPITWLERQYQQFGRHILLRSIVACDAHLPDWTRFHGQALDTGNLLPVTRWHCNHHTFLLLITATNCLHML